MYNFLNLHKLLDFLKENKEEISSKFDMTQFINHDLNEDINEVYKPNEAYQKTIHTCGSSCCLVGWSPSAGIKLKRGEDWFDYCKRVFGVGVNHGFDNPCDSPWEFLFSDDWSYIDNSLECAMLRLEYFIKMKGDMDHDVIQTEDWYEINWQKFLTEELKKLSE